ncbi:hypothetical protein C9374_007688 [Naegleria lovaniensis]|uniref:Ankyrin repeat domain-containing protein n=1 Tax=Naegleria lovaniensis TaxID=51637 RepID=A0AA88GLB8_NAELO|nr:uncharacterized protein C9374_007688 [Naegleria lovaniensis]KAG2379050.1 hypothetical protein C9374_007688 [Naegleria lovaniensis]
MSGSTEDKKQLEKQLRSACEYDEIEKVQKLLHDGVDPNSSDERSGYYLFEKTPLIKAAQWGNLAIVKLLVDEFGATINHQSLIGTALHWATYNGHFEVMKFLLSKGADKTLTNKDGQTAEEIARNRGIKEEILNYLRDYSQ